jgi:hypothetical protein
MTWKDLKPWLKGGIIAGIIAIIFGFIGSLAFVLGGSPLGVSFGQSGGTTFSFELILPLLWFTFIFGITLVIPFFVIGAIIGLIVSKIKSKKKK